MPVQIMQRQSKRKPRKAGLKYRTSGKSKNGSESTNTF